MADRSQKRMSGSLRVVLVLFALSVFGMVITDAPIYARLTYLWGFVLAVSGLWAVFALRPIDLRRRTAVERAQVGQIFQERFDIINEGRLLRLWLEVHDQSPLPGSRGSHVLPIVHGRQRWSYRARTPLFQRGVFPLGDTVLEAGDPLGLFRVRRTFPSHTKLLVYPLTVSVRHFPEPSGWLPGGGAHHHYAHQITPNASSVREYAPGDPIKRIHWPTTARKGRLIVKEFDLDPLTEAWIFLDADREVHTALPYSPPEVTSLGALWRPLTRALRRVALPPSTEEYAVSIAASLAQYFLRRGRTIGFASQGQALEILPPDQGERQLTKILEALALLRARGRLPISGLVTAQAKHIPRDSTAILITPSVHRDVVLAVDRALRQGLRPIVVLLEAASFGGMPGTDNVIEAVAALGVPVCRVANGDDLGAALSVDVAGGRRP